MIITVYDGAGTIGGNKIYAGNGKHGVFLDFGLNFAQSNKYFKDFIKIRSIRGLNDPMEMGLLPKIDVYREDLKAKDFNTPLETLPVDAVLLSHAHVDHYGMMGYLKFNIPIVASPETLALVKAYQDSGKSGEQANVLYSIDKEIDAKEGILRPIKVNATATKEDAVKRNKQKLKEHFKIRPVISTEDLAPGLENYLHLQGYKMKIEHFENHMEIRSINSLPFEIRAYPVDHSIYGATAYVIEDDIAVAYTGDLRLHGERGEQTEIFAKNAKDATILITEGTRATNKEHKYVTEKAVKEKIRAEAEDEKNLIIADFSSRNFERLKTFLEIASKSDRFLVVTEKDAYAIEGLVATGMEFDLENMLIYKKPSESLEWWQKYLGREGGKPLNIYEKNVEKNNRWKDKYVDPPKIRESPGDFILAFSLYDMPNLMDLKTHGGKYIYSSTEAFNEEMELDIFTLMNWLRKYTIEPVGFYIENGKLKFTEGFHASGHASPEDLIKIINIIDPDIIIPVHTENPEWFIKNFENVKIPKNGKKINI